MLTTWGKKILSAFPNNQILPAASIGNSSPCFIECKFYTGDTRYVIPYSTAQAVFISNRLDNTISSDGFAVGSDGSPESENDYTLGNQIIGLNGTIAYSTYLDHENYKYISRVTITISNNTGSYVTIREIGKFTIHRSSTTQGSTPVGSSSNICVMIDRTVLDNPVVIPSGEAGVIVYDIVLG